ncbi:uncharacterized protein LOC113071652 [Carassius auratus]|uniref:Uncharacterized protein LOC113071652 n=1 Tax=Carassius auratus TaxID=7957 RepID=A0A6P6MWJ0_CARAU|nr:uncharacterized protein LOC113071652 [Carassius auratus]
MATVQSVGDMNTLERKLDKRSKKDSEDNAIVGKRIRVAKRLWEDEDEDDPPTAVATVSGTKAAIHNQGAEILDSISLEEQAENSDNELSLVRQELLEIKKNHLYRDTSDKRNAQQKLHAPRQSRVSPQPFKPCSNRGESKVSKGGDGEKRSALDEIKVKAIMDAVMSRHSVSTGQIGAALNGKMAELRLAMSRKNNLKTKCIKVSI